MELTRLRRGVLNFTPGDVEKANPGAGLVLYGRFLWDPSAIGWSLVGRGLVSWTSWTTYTYYISTIIVNHYYLPNVIAGGSWTSKWKCCVVKGRWLSLTCVGSWKPEPGTKIEPPGGTSTTLPWV